MSVNDRERGRHRWLRKAASVLDLTDRYIAIPLCVLALLAMTLLVTADGLSRYVWKSSIPHLDELTSDLIMPMIVFVGLSFVDAVKGHVAVDLLVQHLGDASTRAATALFEVVGAAFLVGIAHQYVLRFQNASDGGPGSTVLVTSQVTSAIVIVGCFLGAIRMLVSACTEVANVERTSFKNTREVVE
jgi:TRAP-type C4-dicarboxylate transport system permease small subunit